MALTVTETDTYSVGNKRYIHATVAFDDDYEDDGEALTYDMFSSFRNVLQHVIVSGAALDVTNEHLLTCTWDRTNEVLRLGSISTASVQVDEAADQFDASDYTVEILAIGW